MTKTIEQVAEEWYSKSTPPTDPQYRALWSFREGYRAAIASLNIIILPHDAEPEVNDVIIFDNDDMPYIVRDYDIDNDMEWLKGKITQRNGQLVKQEEE